MNKRSRAIIIAVVALAGIAVAALGAVAVIPEQDISQEEAIAAVRGFTAVGSVVSVTKEELKAKRAAFEIQVQDGRIFWVDAKTGKVMSVVGKLGEKPADPNELPLTKDSAERRAEDFVRSKTEGFDELSLIHVDGESGDSYSFIWQKVDENGAKLPKWVTLSVNKKTGELGGYVVRDEEPVISTKSQVSKEKAEKIAKAQLSNEAELKACDLTVCKNRDGQQKLVWLVAYTDYKTSPAEPDARAIVNDFLYIDAATGEDVSSQF